MIFTDKSRKKTLLITIIVCVLCVAAGWFYERHKADKQKATVVEPDEIHQTDTVKKKLRVDTDTAHAIQDKVDHVTAPNISYTIEAPTIDEAAEKTVDSINRQDPALPAQVIEKADRTMVTPNEKKQTVDVYKITLRKPHKVKAGILATSDHVYYGAGYQAGKWEGMLYTRTGKKIEAGTVTYTVAEW